MIIERIGDLLASKDVDIYLHQTNLESGVFGAGIALQIAKKYPEAVEADKKTIKGDISKLGNYTFADIRKYKKNGVGPSYIVNLYSQRTLGREGNNTCYTSMYDGMLKFRKHMEQRIKENPKFKLTIGMPMFIGAGLGGGSPKIVRAIIDEVWAESEIAVYLYKLPE